MTRPGWFYRSVEPRVAGYVGTQAAAEWTTSRFWFAVAWVLGVPVGFSLDFWAQSAPSPAALWLSAATAWVAAGAAAVYSAVIARSADHAASAYLTDRRGYRMKLSCPIRPSDLQWKRAVQLADKEHESHVSLANDIGIASAVEQLVERQRSRQVLTRVALGMVGFLLGFILGVVVAFLVGQTKSVGVLAVFGAACLSGILAPVPFRTRFNTAIETFRGEIAQELSSALPGRPGSSTV